MKKLEEITNRDPGDNPITFMNDTNLAPGKMWISTVTLQTKNDKFPTGDQRNLSARNNDRMTSLLRTISRFSSESKEDGIILFPGGWFHSGNDPAESLFPYLEKMITEELERIPAHIIVSMGIDGSIDPGGYDVDQLAVAIDRTGIIAIGRKFHTLTKKERKSIHLASDYVRGESGKPRIFSLNGIRFFPAICYDTYAPQQLKLINPGIDVILSHVHYFVPLNEEGPKGVVDFVRKGFVGASAQWRCPVYGAGIFIRRKIPHCWRTGMEYRVFSKPYLKCTIDENSLRPDMEFHDMQLKEGKVDILRYKFSNF